ncbi:D-alanine--D-alanine ligase [Egicoccus sp. AB-alg6-2]|uniref:D-alanine--D-alanine ligase family protein n=1 Tax=Egicoccus sp. AB-alg6-2 TaxID=3242692 RepID=UPI00359CDECE
MPSNVAVLSGGISLEREVSLRSGSRVADALADRGHEVTRLDVDGELVRVLERGGFDAAVLTLHGSAGEDGTVQALLELVGLPYTGPDVLASSLAWNKPIAQGLYRRAGLQVPRGVTLTQQAFREMGAVAVVDRVADALGLPVVVKPATGGSSLGLTIVHDAAALPQAIVGAFSYADAVLLEQFIAGTEVAVAVLDGRALPAVEIQPKEGAYDFAARYTAGATEFHAPARLDDAAARACAEAAVGAYAAIGARHISRADLIVDDRGTPWVLELDTCPGLTDTSLVPLAAEADGIAFGELCETLLGLALASGRHHTSTTG